MGDEPSTNSPLDGWLAQDPPSSHSRSRPSRGPTACLIAPTHQVALCAFLRLHPKGIGMDHWISTALFSLIPCAACQTGGTQYIALNFLLDLI